MYSPIPRFSESPAPSPAPMRRFLRSREVSPSYNQDLIVPLPEDEECNSNENCVGSTGNYGTTAKENVHQKTDFIPQENEVPPLQPRNSQVSDQSHVFQNNQNNMGQMIIERQEDIVFDASETYHNPPQAMDNDVIFDSPSPHHQENSNIDFFDDNDFFQDTNAMNLQNSTPYVNDLPYRGESFSSRPNQHQTVQNTQNNFGQMRTVQQVQNPSNVVNPAEMYSNHRQTMNTNVFYGAMSQPHQENRNFPILNYNDTLHGNNSMNVQIRAPIVHDLPYRGGSSSSQPIQNTQNNFGQMERVQRVRNPSNVVNPAEMYSNHQQIMNTNVFYGKLPYRGESSSAHPNQNQMVQSGRRGSKRQFVETPDDHNGKYKEFYDIQNMNTKQVCQALIMKLNKLKIYRTVFAEKVLERRQGTSSDLLNRPKAWEDITAGRDTYRRMYMFLKFSDQEMKRIEQMSVAEVQQMMNFPPTTKTERKTSQTNGNNENEEPQAKRQRTEFNSYHKQTFENIFKQNRYPPRELMEELAANFQLHINSVQNWFMNARRREKPNNNTSHLKY